MLTKLPLLGAVTPTVTVQKPLAGITPPVNVTVVPPMVAATLPPQVELGDGMADITIPPGNVSVSGPLMVATVLLALLKVMIRVEVPPALMVAGLKDLPSVTAKGADTVNVARAGPPLLPLLVCRAPAAIELTKLPPLGAVTGTATVQEPLAGIEPPVKVTVGPPMGAVAFPPAQVVLGGPETSMPLGNVSISGALRLAGEALALLNVMVRVETPPAGMVAGLKAFPSVGGILAGRTVKVAIAGPALMPWLVCNAPVGSELKKLPATGAVTPTVTVQELLAGIEPPVRVTVEVPTLAVPPQVVLALPEIKTPMGNVSMSGALMVAGVEFVLLNVMVRVEAPPAVMVTGLNALPSVGGMAAESTVKVAMAGPALLPLPVCKAPAASELMKLPPTGAVTPTITVQKLPAGTEPPVKVTVEVPVVTVPPQSVLGVGVEPINMPIGKVSVSGELRAAAVVPALLKVMVRVEVPPAGMVAGLKALLTVGVTIRGVVTVKVAMAGAMLLPLPVCNAPTPSELMKLPPTGAVTPTVIVQEPPAGMEPPVKVTVERLSVAVPLPQVVLALPEVVTPLGNVSISGTLRLAAVVPALLNVIVRVELPPAAMVAGLKALPSVGAIRGWGTVRVATAGAVLLPLLVCKAPMASELI